MYLSLFLELADYDIIEESASPYLPVIPESLDAEIHGVHLAGYQEVPEVKATTGAASSMSCQYVSDRDLSSHVTQLVVLVCCLAQVVSQVLQ